MKTKTDFNYNDFHQKFSAARTSHQKENVRQEHHDFVAALSEKEKNEYLAGLVKYGKAVMKEVETELNELSSTKVVAE